LTHSTSWRQQLILVLTNSLFQKWATTS